ncbi:ribosomal-protein-alanine N-acetyltransferase [Hamadaea flava]|uniref:GNAT family N-acetyltransferase n=1 Tax=Hamadaea flava TaxID=1742688 RepID=A0ABV8LYU9_9ACTN|nr:GNAT family N-acetyltransferase [Hamadaea flava]MCP2328910.1 ribosomal-protein-alanine N-acetyltransferase [Hamadaea flava]
MIQIRPAVIADAAELSRLYTENREFLRPWEPVRDETFFTKDGQEARLAIGEAARAAGIENRCVIVAPSGEVDAGGPSEIVGMISLTAIERGPVQGAHLGYWVAQSANGRGVGSAAVAAVLDLAFGELGLHRLEAGTLLHNAGSQKVLLRNGFEEIGVARRYIRIAGQWQDHLLFQRLAHDDES